MRIRLMVLLMILVCICGLGWAQAEPKFVGRPTADDYSLTGMPTISGIRIDKTGRIFVALNAFGGVKVYRPDGTFESSFGHRTAQHSEDDPQGFVDVKGLCLDKDGNVYVSEGRGNRIKVFNSMGEPLLTIKMPEFLFEITDPSTGQYLYRLGYPPEAKNLPGTRFMEGGHAYDVSVSSNGNVYAIDGGGNRVVVFDYEGNVLTTFEYVMANGNLTPFQGISNCDFNSKGELYITETLPCICVAIDAKGNYLRHFGKPGNTVGSFQRLSGIGIDDLDRVYCSDFVIGSVQVFDDQGNFLHVLTDKDGSQWKVGNVGSIAVDAKKIYLAEPMVDRLTVRKFVK